MLVNPGEKHPVRLHYRPALRDLAPRRRRWIRRHPVERETAEPRRCHLAGESWRSIRSAHFCKDGCPFMRISMIVFHQRNSNIPRSSSRPRMRPRRWAQLSRRQSAARPSASPRRSRTAGCRSVMPASSGTPSRAAAPSAGVSASGRHGWRLSGVRSASGDLPRIKTGPSMAPNT